MREHKQLVEKILNREQRTGYDKEQRRDELMNLSTEELREIADTPFTF